MLNIENLFKKTSVVSGFVSIVTLCGALLYYGLSFDTPSTGTANFLAWTCVITSVISLVTAGITNMDPSEDGGAAVVSFYPLAAGIVWLLFC